MITQKATILCIYDILKKYTDETHLLPAEKIREKIKIIYRYRYGAQGNIPEY